MDEESELRQEAAQCEHATGERCTCRCGGALHGKRHPEIWISEQIQAMSPGPMTLRFPPARFDVRGFRS